MSESTLTIVFSDLQKAVGFFLGWGSDSSNWSAEELSAINSIVQSGYRKFLVPPKLSENDPVHVWSFTCPNASLSLTAGTDDYDLPADFGGLRTGFYYSEGSLRNPIDIVGIGQVLEDRARLAATGRARKAAIRPKEFTGDTESVRYEVLLYPNPQSDATLYYQYNVLLHKLSDSAPYPIGGMDHGETLLESCLAVAESRQDDELGPHHDLFMERLAASIERDRRVMTPDTLGYNADYSDGSQYGRRSTHVVTVNGVSYP